MFLWLGPFLDVGSSRPLQEDGMHRIVYLFHVNLAPIDLWELPHDRQALSTTDALEHNFYMRCIPADCPRHLQNKICQLNSPSVSSSTTTLTVINEKSLRSKTFENPKLQNTCAPVSQSRFPLPTALYRTFFFELWSSVFFRLCSGVYSFTFMDGFILI